MVELWLRAFLVTVVVELPIGVQLLPRAEGGMRRAAATVLANLASHPILWFVVLRFGWPYELRHIASEAWAIAVEAGLYRLVFPSVSWRRAAAVSLLANGASLAVGLALRALGMMI